MLLFSKRRYEPFKLIRLVDAALFYYISGGVLGYILIEPRSRSFPTSRLSVLSP